MEGTDVRFSGVKALRHAESQVGLGPRPPGSEGSRNLRRYLASNLEALGCAVQEQPFRAHTPLGPVPMVNLLATLPGAREHVLLLAAHYDTCRFEDFVFLGANDGASGVAVLLELARVLSRQAVRSQVTFAFLDGEEALCSWGPRDGLYGSRCLVGVLTELRQLQRIHAVLVPDMVGDRHLRLTRELLSSRWLREMLWDEARRQGVAELFNGPAGEVEDDHLPFLEAGVPAALVTGFYQTAAGICPAYWHTAGDTVDKLAAESLETVGRVIEGVLRRLDLEPNRG